MTTYAQVTDVADEFTGGNSANLPYLVPAIGVPGATARWDADLLTAADNSQVATWKAPVGDFSFTGVGAALKTLDGHRYLSFDGVDDYLSIPTLTTVKTIGVLCRVPALANDTMFGFGAGVWSQTATGNFTVTGGGGSDTITAPTKAPTKWAWRWLTFDGTTKSAASGADTAVTRATASTLTKLELGRVSDGGDYGVLHVAKVALFTSAVTAQQRADAKALFESEYPNSWIA